MFDLGITIAGNTMTGPGIGPRVRWCQFRCGCFMFGRVFWSWHPCLKHAHEGRRAILRAMTFQADVRRTLENNKVGRPPNLDDCFR